MTKVRDRRWLARFIAAPDQVLAEGDPTARALFTKYGKVNMPNLRLGPEDVAALIAHIEEQGAAADVASGSSAAR